MATSLFLTDVVSDVATAAIDHEASLVRGNSGAAVVSTTNTAASGSLIQCTNSPGGTVVEWYSPKLYAVTISGTVTVNLWMSESSMNANVDTNVSVARVGPTGTFISNVVASASKLVELGTSRAAVNYTVAPTSTTLSTGDRLRFIVRGTNIGTMASGFTFDLGYDRSSAGVDGDSFFTFVETLLVATYGHYAGAQVGAWVPDTGPVTYGTAEA